MDSRYVGCETHLFVVDYKQISLTIGTSGTCNSSS